jgi:hypothetical protein
MQILLCAVCQDDRNDRHRRRHCHCLDQAKINHNESSVLTCQENVINETKKAKIE